MKYLTFFDINYMARGVALIDSLLAVVPDADLLVFALDSQTQTMLEKSYGNRIRVLPPNYVSTRWPRLEALRSERKHREYISMRKPCLLYSVLDEETKKDELVVYVDSDCFFFTSPEPALSRMQDVSIGISPHGFSERHAHLVKFGEFNAGFLVLRSDELAKSCMRDWAEDCFNWCYARVEGTKFMNQGYLTQWPKRYPRVVSLDHPGLNLAPWNYDGRTLSIESDGLHINGKPLIFYHFHDMKRQDGRWQNNNAQVSQDIHLELFEQIYAPYTNLLERAERGLVAFGYEPETVPKNKHSPSIEPPENARTPFGKLIGKIAWKLKRLRR